MTGLIVFDWNGTIVSDETDAVRATQVVLRRRAMEPLTRKQFRSSFCLPLSRFLSTLGVSDLSVAEKEWNSEMLLSTAPLSNGVAAAVEALRVQGWRVGVLSAASHSVVERDAQRLDVAHLFDFVEAGVSDKATSLERMALSESVIYVGDTEADIESAQAAGAVAIGFGSGYRPYEDLRLQNPAAVIMSFGELPELVRQLVCFENAENG